MLRKSGEDKFDVGGRVLPMIPASRRDPGLPTSLAAVFAPVNARALGLAVGLTLGMLVALVTTFHVVVQPLHAPNIGLLTQYFYGYAVSPGGVAVGFIWGALTGFALGWFGGVVRNTVLRLTLAIVHRKANLSQPFLDDLS